MIETDDFAPLSSAQLSSELSLPVLPPETPQDDGPIKWNGTEYEATITVGEKTQRFVGKTIGAVAAELVKAQTHASEKIAELTAKKRNVAVDKTLPGFLPIQFKQAAPITAQEQMAMFETFQTNPESAWKMLFERMVGCSPEDIRKSAEQTQSMFARRLADEAAYEFLADHPEDYEATPQNTNRLYKILKDEGLPVTRNNLEYAFTTLQEQGYAFVKPKAQEEQPPDEVSPPPPPRTITGGSARTASEERGGAGGVREAAKLPLGQLRDLIQSSNRAMGTGSRR